MNTNQSDWDTGNITILTPFEFAEKYQLNKKKVSAATIRRRCIENKLPSKYRSFQTRGGHWLIRVIETSIV